MKIHTNDLNELRKYTNTPIFAYCRKLVEEGTTEKTLEVYGGVGYEHLWSVTDIQKGAKLTVDSETTTFKRYIPPNHLKGVQNG